MPKVKLYNSEGKQVGEKQLSAEVFGVKIKPAIVHEVMIGLMASARKSYAHTKVRGDVAGGGKKPWKQKGTGRARQGSTRAPQWRGGAVIFGPRSERDYVKKINSKLKRQALLMALSDKLASDRLVLVEELSAPKGKTRELSGLLAKLPVSGKSIAVVPVRDEMLSRSVKNLKSVRLVTTESLGLIDLLKAKTLVLTPQSADRLEAKYASASAPVSAKGGHGKASASADATADKPTPSLPVGRDKPAARPRASARKSR
jgi:large subunit ribosomal protein L4